MRFQPKGDTRRTCVEECAVFDVRGIAPVRPCVAVQVYYVVAGQPYTPTVQLTTTPTWVRRTPQPWLVCPSCTKRCGRLYLPVGQIVLKCRICWDLRYRSQQTSRKWRELQRRLGRALPRSAPPPITVVHYMEAPRERRPLAPWLRAPGRRW